MEGIRTPDFNYLDGWVSTFGNVVYVDRGTFSATINPVVKWHIVLPRSASQVNGGVPWLSQSKQAYSPSKKNTMKLKTTWTTWMRLSQQLRITMLEATCKDLTAANELLKAKLNDLEGRSRRLNIRIVGIKKGEENRSPTEFVSWLIPRPSQLY